MGDREHFNVLVRCLESNDDLCGVILEGKISNDEQVRVLAAAIRGNHSVTQLYLPKNSIGANGALHLARMLDVSYTLRTLDCRGNFIGPMGAQHLATALASKRPGGLTDLNLSSNNIGPQGAASLAQALETNGSLTSLHLEANHIGPMGAQHIAEALLTNSTLQHLHLGNNVIDDFGARQLANSLRVNGSLKTLDLFMNGIKTVGSGALATMLHGNKTLTRLLLTWNGIEQAGVQLLIGALKFNTTLTQLDLWRNQATYEDLMGVSMYCYKNNFPLLALQFRPLPPEDPACWDGVVSFELQKLSGAVALSLQLESTAPLSYLHTVAEEHLRQEWRRIKIILPDGQTLEQRGWDVPLQACITQPLRTLSLEAKLAKTSPPLQSPKPCLRLAKHLRSQATGGSPAEPVFTPTPTPSPCWTESALTAAGGPARPSSDFLKVELVKDPDHNSLGIEAEIDSAEQSLRIEQIDPRGLIGYFNSKQDVDENKVLVGDRISEVNGIRQHPEKMLHECKVRTRLVLTLSRVRGIEAGPGNHAKQIHPASQEALLDLELPKLMGAAEPSALRPEAQVFVPSIKSTV